jgi:hypothetical protein
MTRPRLCKLLLWTGLGGALGGGANASHCLAAFQENLEWHILPAGILHGALLAVAASLCAWWIFNRGLAVRILALPVAAFLCGYASFLPIALSADFDLKMFAFAQDEPSVWWPFFAFGIVGGLACAFWGAARLLGSPRIALHILAGSASGILGSLWWWIEWANWPYSLLHGAVWGSLVGYGAWRAGRGPCDGGTC